jgi:hypothetical protein
MPKRKNPDTGFDSNGREGLPSGVMNSVSGSGVGAILIGYTTNYFGFFPMSALNISLSIRVNVAPNVLIDSYVIYAKYVGENLRNVITIGNRESSRHLMDAFARAIIIPTELAILSSSDNLLVLRNTFLEYVNLVFLDIVQKRDNEMLELLLNSLTRPLYQKISSYESREEFDIMVGPLEDLKHLVTEALVYFGTNGLYNYTAYLIDRTTPIDNIEANIEYICHRVFACESPYVRLKVLRTLFLIFDIDFNNFFEDFNNLLEQDGLLTDVLAVFIVYEGSLEDNRVKCKQDVEEFITKYIDVTVESYEKDMLSRQDLLSKQELLGVLSEVTALPSDLINLTIDHFKDPFIVDIVRGVLEEFPDLDVRVVRKLIELQGLVYPLTSTRPATASTTVIAEAPFNNTNNARSVAGDCMDCRGNNELGAATPRQ